MPVTKEDTAWITIVLFSVIISIVLISKLMQKSQSG